MLVLVLFMSCSVFHSKYLNLRKKWETWADKNTVKLKKDMLENSIFAIKMILTSGIQIWNREKKIKHYPFIPLSISIQMETLPFVCTLAWTYPSNYMRALQHKISRAFKCKVSRICIFTTLKVFMVRIWR